MGILSYYTAIFNTFTLGYWECRYSFAPYYSLHNLIIYTRPLLHKNEKAVVSLILE